MSQTNAASVRDLPIRSSTTSSATAERELKTARTVVNLLDKYQLDPIIGLLVPGLGDIITTILGAYLVSIAARRGVKPIVIARMLLNLGVDAAVGIVPIVGDLGDFAIRANKKNLELLEARSERKAHWKDWFAVGGAALLVIGMFALAIYALVRLFGAIF
jgi:hypothetical protein